MNEHESLRPKFSASLSFRGFSMRPDEVQSLVGTTASMLVAGGHPKRLGTTPFKKSVASWEIDFPDSTRLTEMISRLISKVGGVERILAARNAVLPEFFEIDITMWIIDSEEQEGGFLEAETLALLARLGVTLGFGFYRRGVT